MTKEIKFIVLGAFVFLLLLAGAVLLASKEGSREQVSGTSQGALELAISPNNVDLGEVPINGGIVTREYEIKNTSGSPLTLSKVATSCMCTTAMITVGDKSTKFFGMEGHGDRNPPINLQIGAGEVAKVTVNFDPAAHGPEGVGPFERIVWLSFSNPSGEKEISFFGTVVSN